MSMRRLPMVWFCEMANAVIGDGGELLEYKQLIANPKMRETWTHSYGNEIGQLAQGMPGRNTGTNTIIFIRKNQVPKEQAKDVTYGLITKLIRPEKIEEPNRTRLVTGGDRVHYPGDAGTPTDGHQGFLSQYPNGQILIYAPAHRRHARRRHQAL
jgi:hypothetical protein